MEKICKVCNKNFKTVTRREYCSSECIKIHRKQYHKKLNNTENRKKLRRLTQQKWIRTNKGKDYNKIYMHDYSKQYRENPKNRELIKGYQKKYYQTEAGKIKIYLKVYKRRARLKQVIHEDYKDWLKELLSHKYFICHWCGKKFSIDKLTLDHVIPISKGGSDTKENLVPACKHCNSTKQARDPEEFNLTLQQPRLFI